MKGGSVVAVLAALTTSVSATRHRHAHEALFKKALNGTELCLPGCTTIWQTITGEATLVPPQTTTVVPALTVIRLPDIPTLPPVATAIAVLPTPIARTCPTPGTYTFPATTVTVDKTTTVCGAASTQVPAGIHTVGGVTTVVVSATTVTCPVATVSVSGTVTTSTIIQTTHVCPSAGTYTIAPITTTVSTSTILVFPTPSIVQPGTYTAPQQVVTVTKTDFVTYCPFSSKGLPASTAAPAPAPAPTSVRVQVPSVLPLLPTIKKPEIPKPSIPSIPSIPAPVSKGLTSNNDHFGITYTPYKPNNGDCKSASEVDIDLDVIKQGGFTTVRVYSTDCNTLENVGAAAKKYGIAMIVGVFVKASGCDANTPDIKEQIDKLAAWGNWDIVKLVVVGNEAIMNGFCTPQQLQTLVTTVKSRCQGKYNGQYTISETLNIWQRSDVSAAMCSVIDVTGANIHAYFNAGVAPSGAGDFVAGQLGLLSQICPGHDVINLECGYPGGGHDNGLAVPGPSEQAIAIKSIRDKAGDKTVFFSFENDLWKPAGQCDCENKWGLAAAFNLAVSVAL